MALEFDNKGGSEWAVNYRLHPADEMNVVSPKRSAATAKKYCEELRNRGYEAEVISRRVQPWKVVPTEKIDTWQEQAWSAWEEEGGR